MAEPITKKRALEVASVIQRRLEASGGVGEVKRFGWEGPESEGKVHRIEIEVSVGGTVPILCFLQGAQFRFADAELEHMASHWLMKSSERTGLSR